MAKRYWIGITSEWNDAQNWSETEGGSGGASVPTKGDEAIFSEDGSPQVEAVSGVECKLTCSDPSYFQIIILKGSPGG